MSEDAPRRPQGPVMLSATGVLRPGPARVGRIAGNFTLPRTVSLTSLIAGGVGFGFGLFLALALGADSLRSYLYTASLLAMAGVGLVTYSPLEGETLLKWLGLNIKSRRRQMTFKGEKVQVAIGVCLIDPPHEGELWIQRGAVNIPASQYDHRGVPLSVANRNLGDASSSRVWVPGTDGVGSFVGPDGHRYKLDPSSTPLPRDGNADPILGPGGRPRKRAPRSRKS